MMALFKQADLLDFVARFSLLHLDVFSVINLVFNRYMAVCN